MFAEFIVCVQGLFSSVVARPKCITSVSLGYGKSPCFRCQPFMSPIDLGYGRLFFACVNIANMRECA